MSQRAFGRILVLVTLTLTLALAVPVRAAVTPQRIGPVSLWGWLQNLWQEGIGRLAGGEPQAPARSGTHPGSLEKNCTALDPNGCPSTPTSGGGGSITSGSGDK